MRICFFARANYELVRRRAESMAARGHEVHIITLHEGWPNGARVYVLRPMIPGPLRYLWVLPAVRRLVRQIGPDVIDVHGLSGYGLWAALPYSIATVVTSYGPDLSMHAPKSALLRAFMRSALRRADLVYGSTDVVGDLALEQLGLDIRDRLVVQSWGVPCDELAYAARERRHESRKRFGAGPDDHVVLHARHLTGMWRVREIIESIPVVLEHDPRTQFWFVYPPPNREGLNLLRELKERVAAIGATDQVQFIGPQKYYDYITIAHGADTFLCIGRSDLLASTLLEGMFVGLIPVLARLPAYREVIREGRNGLFLDRFDARSIAHALRAAIQLDPARRHSMAEHNRKIVRTRYDAAACTDWLLDRLQELVSVHGNGRNGA